MFIHDQLVFIVSDSEAITFNSSQDVERLISSGTNFEELIEFVNSSILSSLEEEIFGINNIESSEQKHFTKTASYAKLLMPIAEYAKMKKFEQEQLALKESNENDWNWTGPQS
jgi:hypothetical protein